jgi:septal ring factor EnvC (AmiA/AmiB activator)
MIRDYTLIFVEDENTRIKSVNVRYESEDVTNIKNFSGMATYIISSDKDYLRSYVEEEIKQLMELIEYKNKQINKLKEEINKYEDTINRLKEMIQ